jgi:hypothetical protein
MRLLSLNTTSAACLTLAGVLGLAPVSAQAQHFHGNLTHYSPISQKVRPGHHYALYKVYLHAGEAYDIELESHDFDPYLYVLHHGHIEGQNDDGGPGLSSSLRFHPHQSDWYEILVTTFGHDETGHFHLDIHSHHHHHGVSSPPH